MIRSIVVTALLAVFLCAAASAQDTRVVNGGVVNGKAISLPKPAYPESLKATGIGGTIAVNVVIDESGTVIEAVAELNDQKERRDVDGTKLDPVPADPLLREAAEAAALQARFSPTFLNGGGVRVRGKILYNFVGSGESETVPAPAPAPKSVSGGVLNGKAISLPPPAYPPAAMAVRAGGAVSVQVLVDEGGNVISAAAVSGHPLLRAAAEAAAREARFAPTLLSGTPVKISGVITYNFVADKPEN